MNARMIPPGFRQAPVPQAADGLLAEHNAMFKALQEIARTDGRYGLQMKEIAAQAVRQILEQRVEERINERRAA